MSGSDDLMFALHFKMTSDVWHALSFFSRMTTFPRQDGSVVQAQATQAMEGRWAQR